MKKGNTPKTAFANITVGLQLGITVAVFVYGGYRLDIYNNTSPVFLLIGASLGMGIGFYNLLKEMQGMKRKSTDQTEEKKDKWM